MVYPLTDLPTTWHQRQLSVMVTKRKRSLTQPFPTGSVKRPHGIFVGKFGNIHPLKCPFLLKIPPQGTYSKELSHEYTQLCLREVPVTRLKKGIVPTGARKMKSGSSRWGGTCFEAQGPPAACLGPNACWQACALATLRTGHMDTLRLCAHCALGGPENVSCNVAFFKTFSFCSRKIH